MSTLSVRPAEPSEADLVHAYLVRQEAAEGTPREAALGEEAFRRDWLGLHRGKAFFACADGRPVGCVIALPGLRPASAPLALYAASVFVEPSVRGCGAGRALVARLCELGRTLGRTGLMWCCYETNAAACAFSEALGAVETGRDGTTDAAGRTLVVYSLSTLNNSLENRYEWDQSELSFGV